MSPACDVGGTASQKLSVMRNLTTEQWERATDVPLMVAALAFLAAYAIPILKPDLPSWAAAMCIGAAATAWALFVVDYVVRLRLAPDRRTYVRKHVLDLLVIALAIAQAIAATAAARSVHPPESARWHAAARAARRLHGWHRRTSRLLCGTGRVER